MPRLTPLLTTVAATFGILVALAPEVSAGGWQEVHQASDDVRVTVASDGVATVQHHLRYRVVAGRFKAFDFAGLDPRAELVTETSIVNEKAGGDIPARVEPNPKQPGAVKIAFDEPRGLGRGIYLVDVKYRVDLVATKMLVRDGAMWKLAWTAPVSPEGHDGARVIFEVPSAPTEPRLASPELAATTLATLHREVDKDELELVRAHVPRGEAAVWAARVDPKAFPRVVAPELRPPPSAVAPPPPPDHVPLVLVASSLAILAGALAFALRAKQAAAARAAEACAMEARPLVAVPWGLGPFLYAGAVVGALALLLWGPPSWGAILVVVAMVLAAHREARPSARPRGPGRWQRVADEAVLVASPREPLAGDAFDIGTRKGRLVALAIAAVLAAMTFVLRHRVPGVVVTVPLVSAALVPLFATGTRGQLPRSPAEHAATILGPARDALGRLVDLGHVDVTCLARFREGTSTYDEVRLACVPADRIPGLRAIELAVASPPTGAPVAIPEVLVRFDDGSHAAAKIAELAPGVRIVPGRAPEEKVLRLAPRVPTAAGAARLLARLATDLEGRRATDRPSEPGAAVTAPPPSTRFPGKERRAPLGPPRLAPAA